MLCANAAEGVAKCASPRPKLYVECSLELVVAGRVGGEMVLPRLLVRIGRIDRERECGCSVHGATNGRGDTHWDQHRQSVAGAVDLAYVLDRADSLSGGEPGRVAVVRACLGREDVHDVEFGEESCG